MKLTAIFAIALFSASILSCSSTQDDSKKETTDESATPGTETSVNDEPEVCDDLKSFVPDGWKIVKQPKGDLNKDGIEDVALVIQKTDTKLVKKTDAGVMDTNPRTLIVLFGTSKKGCYVLNTKSESFIVDHDDEYMDDPFAEIEIKNGTLKINFSEFRSIGSWETAQYKYVWRFQEGSFKLIGASVNSFHRADGDGVEYSINFSTNKYSVKTYNMFDEDEKEVVTWKKLDVKGLKTFETFRAPWTWSVNQEVHI